MTNPSLSGIVDDLASASEIPTESFSARGRLTEDDFLLVRELTEKRATTGFQDVLISFLPFLLIVGLLYFLFVRQLKSAGKGAMALAKAKLRCSPARKTRPPSKMLRVVMRLRRRSQRSSISLGS